MSLAGWHSDKEERRRWRAASGRSGRRRWEGGLVTPKRADKSGLGMRKGSAQKGVLDYNISANHDHASKMESQCLIILVTTV